MGTVIASSDERSYIVTAADQECRARTAYVRGDRTHGFNARIVALDDEKVLRSFRTSVPRDILVIAIEKGNLYPASVDDEDIPKTVSVAGPPNDKPYDLTASRVQKDVRLISAGPDHAYVTGAWGIGIGTGVFDPVSGSLVGIINRKESELDSTSKWISYVVSFSSRIQQVIPYLAEDIGLLGGNHSASTGSGATSVTRNAIYPVLRHGDVLGKPGYIIAGVAVAIARSGNQTVLVTSSRDKQGDDLAVQMRDSDGTLMVQRAKMLGRDADSDLAVLSIPSGRSRIPSFVSDAPNAHTVQVDCGFCSWQDDQQVIECVPRQTPRHLKVDSPMNDGRGLQNVPDGQFLLDHDELGIRAGGAPIVDVDRAAIIGIRVNDFPPMMMSMKEVAVKIDAMSLGISVPLQRN